MIMITRTYIKNYAIITLLAFVGGLMPVAFVSAVVAPLVVVFEHAPLFSEANFLPGENITRWVKVTNNTPDTKKIAIEAINKSDPNHLGDTLDLVIKEGATERYHGTLSAFFAAGQISLSSLAGNGGSTQYDLTVSFLNTSNNTYQEKNLHFDILIGFQGEEGGASSGGGPGGGEGGPSGSGPSGGDGGGGGGSGGGYGYSGVEGLSISGETVRISDVGETSVTIEWLTSYVSTSRVVYGPVAGGFTLASPPNYGYPFSTPESDTPAHPNGVTLHHVTISGLTPGATYYYRTISHASPDTVSYEHKFETLPGKPSTSQSGSTRGTVGGFSSGEVSGSASVSNGGNFIADGGGSAALSPSPESPATGQQSVDQPPTEGDQSAVPPQSPLFASLFGALPFGRFGNVLILIVVGAGIVIALWRIFRRRAHR